MTLQIDAGAGAHEGRSVEPAVLRPTLRDYGFVFALIAGTALALGAATQTDARVGSDALRGPLAVLLLLTALVWLAMALVRNVAVMTGRIDAAYYVDYKTRPPPDWIERPARTFNNLLQLPVLFYVACLLMMQAPTVDAGQVRVAWLFAGLRVLHAVAYVFWNRLPSRFGSYVASTLALIVLWVRILSA